MTGRSSAGREIGQTQGEGVKELQLALETTELVEPAVVAVDRSIGRRHAF